MGKAATTVRRISGRAVRTAYSARARIRPDALWDRYADACQAAGVGQPFFLLSLDCDTEKDIDVGWDVWARLSDAGIRPTYAVPGELVERGHDLYGRLVEAGASFINHGYAQHTTLALPERVYHSYNFYDALSPDVVEEDIRRGDAVLRDVLGVTPAGFRTPHFGSFQRPDQLRWLHGVISSLGYAYSTSTMPLWGLRHGPAFDKFGVMELPVTGCPSAPLSVLDSWSFRFDPGRTRSEGDYLAEVTELAQRLHGGQPLVVNLYADPSQVYDWPEWFEAMGRLGPFAVSSYDQLLEGLGR